jgi:hypothetical protein
MLNSAGGTSGFLFVPLSPLEASALLAVYGARFIARADTCSIEHLRAVEQLHKRLQLRIDAANASGASLQSYFMRLSSRSPKDGIPLAASELRAGLSQLQHRYGIIEPSVQVEVGSAGESCENQHQSTPRGPHKLTCALDYDQLIERIQGGALSEERANEFLCAAFALMHKAMRVQTAVEVLALLTSSERVAIDLSRALDAFEIDPSSWRQHVILRPWDPRIQDRLEFRCFIHRNTFRALSQYNTYILVPELVDPNFRAEVYRCILRAWETQYKRALEGLEHYVADFAYDIINAQALLIEVNPYEESTGSAFFDWHLDSFLLKGETHEPPTEEAKETGPTQQRTLNAMIAQEEIAGEVLCRCRVHSPSASEVSTVIHMFVGETMRELCGPKERWHYVCAVRALQTKTGEYSLSGSNLRTKDQWFGNLCNLL